MTPPVRGILPDLHYVGYNKDQSFSTARTVLAFSFRAAFITAMICFTLAAVSAWITIRGSAPGGRAASFFFSTP